WSVLYPLLPAYRVVLAVLKYVRGKLPVRTSLLAYMMAARAICRRLLAHLARLACSRARFRLGSRIEISRAMMPMTTSSSTSVNPRLRRERCRQKGTCSFITRLLAERAARGTGRPAEEWNGWMSAVVASAGP